MQKKAMTAIVTTMVLGLILISLSLKNDYAKHPGKTTTTQVTTESSNLAQLPQRPNRQAIHFGASISKTGHFQTEGHNVVEGYDLWQHHVNNNGGIKIGDHTYQIVIKYYDDESNIEKLRENITKLIIDDKVDFILGPFSSGFNLAASKITEKYGKIMIESGGASDTIFTRNQNFTFATQTSASWWFKDFFELLDDLEPRAQTYALITPDKLFTRSVAKGVQIWAAAHNINEVYFKVTDTDTANFIPYLLEMVKQQPDIIILTSHYQDAVEFSTQLAAVKELQPNVVVMTIGPSERNYTKDVGSSAEMMVGITQWVAESSHTGSVFSNAEEYVKEFVARYQHLPTYQNAQSSATGVIYQLALEQAGTLDAAEVLQKLRDTDTITFYGKVKYNHHGMNIGHKMALVQIQDGKAATIWPPDVATSTVRYPLNQNPER